MLASDNVYSLINYLSFAKWLFLGLSAAVLPYMRWKRPDLPRTFKVNDKSHNTSKMHTLGPSKL